MDQFNQTPKSSRLHIALFGRRNAGKSSLINALTGQKIALVSEQPGTTTDPVAKAMELLPLGPVVMIDTAGLDDSGSLGALRVEKTYEVLNRTDLAILVVDGAASSIDFEQKLLTEIRAKNIPIVGVITKLDQAVYSREQLHQWQQQLQLELIEVAATTGEGVERLKMAIIRQAPYDDQELFLIGDLAQPGDVVVLVVPIDKAAPKGRLILPQQQVIRDLLEHDAIAVVTKEHELRATLSRLKTPPALVITDSQVFLKVAADTPSEIPLTSFSILFARYKGDLRQLTEGVLAIQRLQPGDKVLIIEGCTHHRQSDDIGTVKIPRWLRQKVGGELQFEWAHGMTFPKTLKDFQLVVHCGACMLNRREMIYRLATLRDAGVPVVNYGMLIACVQGILPRVLQPFSEVREMFTDNFKDGSVSDD